MDFLWRTKDAVEVELEGEVKSKNGISRFNCRIHRIVILTVAWKCGNGVSELPVDIESGKAVQAASLGTRKDL